MRCVEPDERGGGRSLLMEAGDVRDEIREHLGAEVVSLLQRDPVPWRVTEYHGGDVVWRPVLTESTVCWRRYTIDEFLAFSDRRVDLPLAEGELLITIGAPSMPGLRSRPTTVRRTG